MLRQKGTNHKINEIHCNQHNARFCISSYRFYFNSVYIAIVNFNEEIDFKFKLNKQLEFFNCEEVIRIIQFFQTKSIRIIHMTKHSTVNYFFFLNITQI